MTTHPHPTPIRVLATRWCGDCQAARRVLESTGVAYDWIDIDENEEARDEVMRVSRGMRSVPTLIFPDGSVLVEPTRRALLAKLTGGRADPRAGEACADRGVPDCDTGPFRRLAFVARELRQIITRRPTTPGSQP